MRNQKRAKSQQPNRQLATASASAEAMPQADVHEAYNALIALAISRAEAKRNEPGGEGRLALVQRNAPHARVDLQGVAVDVARGIPYHTAIAAHGLNHIAFMAARAQNLAYAMVFSAAEEVRDKGTAQKCLSAFSRLLDVDEPNIKAVLAGLEHLCGSKWARGSGDGRTDAGGAKIVYNIQLLHAPRAERVTIDECANGARIVDAEDVDAHIADDY